MTTFFEGFGGSHYAGLSAEYYETVRGSRIGISRCSSFGGNLFDPGDPPGHPLQVSDAISEVCFLTGGKPSANTVYFLYTASGATGDFCAWHASGGCAGGAPVRVAYIPDLDGVSGCDPQDTWTSHDAGLAAIANVTAHELSEVITDPDISAWHDAAGSENGDKCNWVFDAPVKLANGSIWKLQDEWSNAAFDRRSGSRNADGDPGCAQGD